MHYLFMIHSAGFFDFLRHWHYTIIYLVATKLSLYCLVTWGDTFELPIFWTYRFKELFLNINKICFCLHQTLTITWPKHQKKRTRLDRNLTYLIQKYATSIHLKHSKCPVVIGYNHFGQVWDIFVTRQLKFFYWRSLVFFNWDVKTYED